MEKVLTDDQRIARARKDYLKSLTPRLQALYSHAAMLDRQAARLAGEINQPIKRFRKRKWPLRKKSLDKFPPP